MHKVSEEKMIRYLETARQRKALAEQERLRRLDYAWEIARLAAQILYKQFNCSRVAAFGSMVHPDLFHAHSDVDLAVWDIQEPSYLKAVAAVTSLNSNILVDVIVVEEASDSLQQVIEQEGQVL